MSLALCDPDAFYPLRDLVEGPFNDVGALVAIERFVRAVVLHDEITMDIDPLPYDPEGECEGPPETGNRNVIVGFGPPSPATISSARQLAPDNQCPQT
jgi:hypothetical protein